MTRCRMAEPIDLQSLWRAFDNLVYTEVPSIDIDISAVEESEGDVTGLGHFAWAVRARLASTGWRLADGL